MCEDVPVSPLTFSFGGRNLGVYSKNVIGVLFVRSLCHQYKACMYSTCIHVQCMCMWAALCLWNSTNWNYCIIRPLPPPSAGSIHVPQSRAIFEVKKGTGQETSPRQPTDEAAILSVTIFRELRGRSEVVVFLSSSPVRGTCTMCLCMLLMHGYLVALFFWLQNYQLV